MRTGSDGRGDRDVQLTDLLGGACPFGKSHSVNAQNAPGYTKAQNQKGRLYLPLTKAVLDVLNTVKG